MAQRACPVRHYACLAVRAQSGHRQRADFEADARGGVGELHAVGEGEALGYEVVEDQVEGAFAEEVCADVQVAGVAGAEVEGFLREAVGGDMGESGRENFCFAFWVGRRWAVFVGVVEGAGGLLDEERSESRGGAQEAVAE